MPRRSRSLRVDLRNTISCGQQFSSSYPPPSTGSGLLASIARSNSAIPDVPPAPSVALRVTGNIIPPPLPSPIACAPSFDPGSISLDPPPKGAADNASGPTPNDNSTQKMLPESLPTRDRTPSRPWLRRTICRTSARPKPEPLPPWTRPISVCTYGEKRRRPPSTRSRPRMPTPVS